MTASNVFDHLRAIQQIMVRSPLGLILDFDGTISEIAPTPDDARISPVCRQHLASISRAIEVMAILSGRPVEDVRGLVGLEGMIYIGNHGLEWWVKGSIEVDRKAQQYLSAIAKALDQLKEMLPGEDIIFEDKGVVAAVHYRRCKDRESARKAILSAINRLQIAKCLRVSEGKMVVELRPPLEFNKGTAVKSLVERFGLQGAIYLGDDITDIDAFSAIHRLNENLSFEGIAVAVVGDETPDQVRDEADFILDGVSGVGRFLEWMMEEALLRREP